MQKLESVAQLTQALRIPDNWDAIMVGDGSGTKWSRAMGWACTVIDRHSNNRMLTWGGAYPGTNNVAEIMAYVHAVSWYVGKEGFGHKWLQSLPKGASPILNVAVVTDSEITANIGNGVTKPNSNKAFWAAMKAFQMDGVLITWYHYNRALIGLNELADEVAGENRKSVATGGLSPEEFRRIYWTTPSRDLDGRIQQPDTD